MAGAEEMDARLARVEASLDSLTETVRGGFERRAADVDRAFADQRQYTDFAFSSLRSEMNGGFERLERKIDWIVEHLSNRG
jgi:hypothetical protein